MLALLFAIHGHVEVFECSKCHVPIGSRCRFYQCRRLPCAMKYWTMHFGFAGSAAAVVTYHCCQPTVLLLYLYIFKPYKTECWPGLREAWRAAIQSWESFELFFYLGAGGILSSSECTWQQKGRNMSCHHHLTPCYFLLTRQHVPS
jgi:hypothetical protein